MQDILIKVHQLSKFFQPKDPALAFHALKDVSLNICAGEIYGIIGMSGAGKSTLLRCLTGLEKPSSGSIYIGAEEISKKAPHELYAIRKQFGLIFQHFQLFSSRTVEGNILYPLEIHGVPPAVRQERLKELLHLVGLEHKQHAYPAQLSGGEKQRVGIARSLALAPKILFCDEATSALDPKTVQSTLQLLLKLNKELGLTIVMITHQMDVVKRICHRVAVLSHGQVVEEGSVENVFARPQHMITKRLLHLDFENMSDAYTVNRDTRHTLVRLDFEGRQAREPVISQLVKQYAVEANILSGSLDHLHNTTIGHLFIELSGSTDEIQRALLFLQTKQIHCEVQS